MQLKINNAIYPALRDFNFKFLNNRLATNLYLSRIKEIDSPNCPYCNQIENEIHMLFACPRILQLWQNVSNILNIRISYKLLYTGFIHDLNYKLIAYNYIFSQILQCIYMYTNYSRRKKLDVNMATLKYKIIYWIKNINEPFEEKTGFVITCWDSQMPFMTSRGME